MWAGGIETSTFFGEAEAPASLVKFTGLEGLILKLLLLIIDY